MARNSPTRTTLCPECTMTMMTKCVKPRAGAAAAAAWPLIPYMRANLLTKRTNLARAGAIIAPSHHIAKDLVQRAPEIAGTRITVYDVMDYYKHGWHRDQIAALFRLSSRDIQAAIDYIEAKTSKK